MEKRKSQNPVLVSVFFFVFSFLFFLLFSSPALAEKVQCEYIPKDSSQKILYFEGTDADHRPWLKEMERDECIAGCGLLRFTCSVSGGFFGGPIEQNPANCDATYLVCGPTTNPVLKTTCKFVPKTLAGQALSTIPDLVPFARALAVEREILTPSESDCQTICNNFCAAINSYQGDLVCNGDKSCETAPIAPPAAPLPYTFTATAPKLEIPLPTLPSLTTFTDFVATGDPGDRYLLIPWLGEYIAAIYKYAIGITGVLAGIMIVVAGLLWLTAGGDAGRISTAKGYIEGAMVGLVIALTSYVLLYAINPKLTEFDAMKVRFVERAETGGTAENSGTQETCPQVTPLDCNDPNTTITWEKFNNVDLNLFPDKVREYVTGSNGINKSLIPKYKTAAAGKIPWEMLAVLHRREGGGDTDTSVLNGSSLCNNNDNSSCAACGCPGPDCGEENNPKATRENDLTCGVELILKKAGRVGSTLQHNEADFETIKKAFGKYAGSASGCYDATYHMTAFFDQHHSNMWKAGIDCISMQGNCDDTCVTDATLSPRSPKGCCTIKVYKRGKAPAGFDPRGSFCNNIQRPACKIAEDETTATYKYKACTTISEDPCGALQPQDRPGAFTIYAWLKKAQQADASLR